MSNTAFSTDRVAKVTSIVQGHINSYFAGTLGREFNIAKIVNGMIFIESQFNVNAIGDPNPAVPGTTGYKYKNSSAITTVFNSGSPTQKTNINNGLRAIGIMQVVGWNYIKGGAPSGVCEIQRLRPDLAGPLLVQPGDDPIAPVVGEANLSKALLLGLIVLEGKYKNVYPVAEGFKIKGDPKPTRVFKTKINAAVAGYLGLGTRDRNDTTPEVYSARAVGGSAYFAANGGSPLKISDSKITVASANGPSTNGTGAERITVPGCA